MTGPVRGHRHVGQALGAVPARELDQLVDLRAADASAIPGADDRLDAAAGGQGFVEDAEAAARLAESRPASRAGARSTSSMPKRRSGLSEPKRSSASRVVDAREWELLDRPVRHDRLADLDDHRLHEVHDPLLVHEAHLQVELGELGLAVAAQILVAEAARDLEVAVHARDHEQLLELLGALRQGVDAARLEAAGDDEVAGALGRGLEQDRRLDLHEAGAVVGVADRPDQLGAEQQPLQQRAAADVQVAVLEAERLVDWSRPAR